VRSLFGGGACVESLYSIDSERVNSSTHHREREREREAE
jgi:hypothetical protein